MRNDGSHPAAELAADASAKDKSLIRWIRTVMAGALVIPLTSFVLIAGWGYQKVLDEAQAKVSQASALSLRQAGRFFDASLKIATFARSATAGSDADIRANEQQIHQRLADLCAGLGYVANMTIWSADGQSLARSDIYPVDRSSSNATRQYFIDQQRGPDGAKISEVIVGRASGRELFNLTIRRTGPDGEFNGIIAVSLSPESFRDYYRSLASDDPDLASFALVRTDGTLLARWPDLPGRTAVNSDNPIFERIRSGAVSGFEIMPAREGRQRRLISFRRVEGWPVYVTAGVSHASVVAEWMKFTTLLLAVILPITLGLLWVSWIALRKIEEEQQAAAAMRREIERRGDAEKQIIEGQKLQTLAQLTAGVAHDFNNLLTIVANNLHIVGRRHPELMAEKHLSSIHRAVQSGVRLTRQLLSFTRKQALRPELVDLRLWLKDTEALLRSTVGGRTRLAFDVAPDTQCVEVDIAELELALINTALNAQHAMPDGGHLRIAARNAVSPRDGSAMVLVSVEDDGAGIPAELLTRVFEPFFSTKGRGEGSGLGLSQVAGLCDQAGGFADIDSEVGRGTTVLLYFPAMGACEDAMTPPAAQAVPKVRGRVLLVEDNPDVAIVTGQVLREAGLVVIGADQAASALATMSKEAADLDLVISDISMPGTMDGIQLALAIREHWPAMPVILLTGYAEKIHDAVSAGLRVLAKPVPPGQLIHEIHEAVGAGHVSDRRVDVDRDAHEEPAHARDA